MLKKIRADKIQALLLIAFFIVLVMSAFHTLLTPDVLQSYIFLHVLNFIFLALFLFLFKSYPLQNIKEIKSDKLFLMLWFLFSLFILISEIFHQTVVESIYFILIIPFVYFFSINFFIKNTYVIHIMIVIIGIPALIFVLLMSLKGHEFKTNSIALMVLTSAVSFIILERPLIKKNLFGLFISHNILSLIYLYALFAVRSRTSIVAFAFVYIANMISNFHYFSKNKSPYTRRYIKFYTLMFTLVIGALMLYSDKLTFFLHKWNSDITSGRGRIWTATLNNVNFLGHGYDWYIQNHLVGPHNIFFSILGFTGVLPLLFFCAIVIKLLYDLIKRGAREQLLLENREFLLYSIGFFVAGMFEGYLQFPVFRPFNLVWFILLGRFYIKAEAVPLKAEIPNIGSTKLVPVVKLVSILLIICSALSLLLTTGDGNILNMADLFLKYFE